MLQRTPIKVILLQILMLSVFLFALSASAIELDQLESEQIAPKQIENNQIKKNRAEPEWIKPNWKKLETRYTIVQYPSIEKLEQFHKSIHFGDGWWATSSSFTQLSVEENRKISEMKIDAIFKRVQEILDMNKKFKKVIIILYPDKAALEEAYMKTYKKKSPFKAWYEYKTNTISLNVDDCYEGMLAHEMAHSIIDNFLKIRPPKNTAEILARYVDTHLK